MSERNSPGSGHGLEVHLEEFLAKLATAGYTGKTRHDKWRLIVPFIRWAQGRRLAVSDLDEACVDAFLARPSRRRYKHGTALRQFLEHLCAVGVAPPSQPSGAVARRQTRLEVPRPSA